jgi:DNA-binding transcriptional MerR regulator
MTDNNLRTYSIKTASIMVDMNAHTIRAWERRYQALDPDRNEENNRRQYSHDDIERLTLLSRLVKAGHQISHIAGLSNEILTTMISTPRGESTGDRASPEGVILQRCLSALETYELAQIHAELEAARHFLSVPKFLTEVALPLLREVGLKVADGRCTVGQEHAFSSILRAQLMQTLFNVRNAVAVRALTRKDHSHGLAICLATREGDWHEFGILSAAILIANEGHIPHYFGPNMPARSLAEAARAVNANVVLVGNTPAGKADISGRQGRYIEDLLSQLPVTCNIWWGGDSHLPKEEQPEQVALVPTLDELTRLLKLAF